MKNDKTENETPLFITEKLKRIIQQLEVLVNMKLNELQEKDKKKRNILLILFFLGILILNIISYKFL